MLFAYTVYTVFLLLYVCPSIHEFVARVGRALRHRLNEYGWKVVSHYDAILGVCFAKL